MSGVFLLVMFLGLGAVAVWLHVRFPSRRPGSLVGAAVHLALSLVVCGLLPGGLALLLTHIPPSMLRVYLGLALLIPTVTYFLLSLIWLGARIVQDLLGGPRGGLPVGDGAG